MPDEPATEEVEFEHSAVESEPDVNLHLQPEVQSHLDEFEF